MTRPPSQVQSRFVGRYGVGDLTTRRETLLGGRSYPTSLLSIKENILLPFWWPFTSPPRESNSHDQGPTGDRPRSGQGPCHTGVGPRKYLVEDPLSSFSRGIPCHSSEGHPTWKRRPLRPPTETSRLPSLDKQGATLYTRAPFLG